MSSDIFTRPVDVSKYDLIYGGAQKNIAPAGVTFVIVRRDAVGHIEDNRIIPTDAESDDTSLQGLYVQYTSCLPRLRSSADDEVVQGTRWCEGPRADEPRKGWHALR